MNYSYPDIFKWQWAVAAYALVAGYLAWRQWAAHRRALHGPLALRFGLGLSAPRLVFKWACWCLAAWLLLVALAGPLGQPVQEPEESEGADVILAVDVSGSMMCQDVAPNRLTALKQALNQFIERLDGDRVGLVAFAGQPVIACPLTNDYETTQLFLDKMDNDSVPIDGTAIGRALAMCLDKFELDPKRGRLIVLATDGEDTLDSDMAAQAKRAGEMGIPIYTLGIGTDGGAVVPGSTDVFGRVLPKLYHGEPVVSRMNPETLKQIASLSGGQYFHGASPEAIQAAFQRLRELKQSRVKTPAKITRELLYQKWLLWAFCLLGLEALLSKRKGGWAWGWQKLGSAWLWLKDLAMRRWQQRAMAKAAMLLAIFIFTCGFSLDPGRSEYDQGNEFYRQGKYEEAAKAYQDSLQQKQRECTLYNLGNADFQKEDYQSAVDAYERALQLDPKDADAAYNLELARKKLEESQKNTQQKDKQQDQKKDDQKKGQQSKNSSGGQKQQDQAGNGNKKEGENSGGKSQANKKEGGNKEGEGQGNAHKQEEAAGQKGKGEAGTQTKAGANANALNSDEAQALMNMLANDQKRFQGAFQPLKKRQRPQAEDPVEQMFEQMTGMRFNRPQDPRSAQGDVKDW